jgi:1,4-dihydroxy-2-naphthoate octaprenyltransferase
MTTKPPARLDWKLLLRMTRPGFLTITAVACLLGIASAASSNGATDWRLALLTLVLALAAHGWPGWHWAGPIRPRRSS